jgi:hypothetical protein
MQRGIGLMNEYIGNSHSYVQLSPAVWLFYALFNSLHHVLDILLPPIVTVAASKGRLRSSGTTLQSNSQYLHSHCRLIMYAFQNAGRETHQPFISQYFHEHSIVSNFYLFSFPSKLNASICVWELTLFRLMDYMAFKEYIAQKFGHFFNILEYLERNVCQYFLRVRFPNVFQ